MSKRLTNAIKDTIVARVVEKTFKERNAKEEQLEHAAGRLAYDALVPLEHQKIMDSLPKGYFDTTGTVSIELVCSATRTKTHRLSLGCSVHDPAMYRYGSHEVRANDALLAALNEYYDFNEKLATDTRALRNKLNTLMASVNTDKRLLEVWPEASAYIPYELFPAQGGALAITGSEINAQIKCSVEANCEHA